MIRIIIFAALISIPLTAQVKETAEPILNQLSIWKPVTLEQLSIDIQNKNETNNVVPNGNQANVSGENIIYINQTGNFNDAIIDQNGTTNFANIIQVGNGNFNKTTQDGEDISTTNEQVGNHNYIFQDLTGNELNYTIFQEGNLNKVIQVENNGPLKEYQVFQKGNGARVIIINGSVNK